MQDTLRQINNLLDQREIKKAEVQIAKALRTDPEPYDRAELLLYRARARLIDQHPDDTLEDIQTARALNPAIADRAEIAALLADTYFARFELSPVGFAERSDANKALSLYKAIVRDEPAYENLGWIFYQQGRVLLSAGETDTAVTCLQEALLKPSTVTALTAFCYERLGFIHLFDYRDTTTALAFLNKAVVTYPPSEPEGWLGQLHILRSRALKEQHHYTEALSAATQALDIMEKLGPELRGGKQDAHLAIGEILVGQPGREAEAVYHLQQFLQLGKKPLGIDVTWSRVNELLGDMQFRLERFEAAIEAYNNALSFNPYHPWQATIYYQIARAHYRLRAYEKTITTIERLLSALTEDNQELTDYRVYHLLGNAHFALESFGRAVPAYRRALELAPSNADDMDKIEAYLRFSEELCL